MDWTNKLKNNETLTIAIDFDGTVVTHEYPNVGKDVGAIPILKKFVTEGHKLILFTMRDGEQLTDAINWFKSNEIELYGIQYNPSQKHWTKSNKCYANLYIDDAAFGCPLIFEGNERPYVDWNAINDLFFNDALTYELKELDHLHDVVYEAIDKSLNNDELKKLIKTFPEDILMDILHWGLSDTVVRDNIYTYLKKNN